MDKEKKLYQALIAPFLKDPTSFATSQALFERAEKVALEEGLTPVQAKAFASWASTLAGWSEPFPIPVPIGRLNATFARAAWGEGSEHYLPRLESVAAGAEGDYEAGLRAVLELIRKEVV